MPVNDNDYQQRMEGYEIALKQFTPILEDQAETIERMSDEPQIKENKVKSKKVQIEADYNNFDYKFDDVVLENSGQMSYDTFDFSVFEGMSKEIEEIEHEYKIFEAGASGKYTQDYILDRRVEAISQIADVKTKYFDRAIKQIEELRTPTMTVQALSSHDEMMNQLKRLNNNIVASEMMRTADVETLEMLFENNREVVEVRTMIKMRAFHLYRILKDKQVREKAFKLYQQIKSYEYELKRPEYFQELDSIQYNIEYIFKRGENTFPEGLENGFKGYRSRKFFS